MSEKEEVIVKEEEVLDTVPEIEQAAMENGWRPKEEFEADPANQGKKWRPAEDFMDRKPLFDKIDVQHRELRNQQKEVQDLKKTVVSLVEHNKKIEENAYSRALKELKAERKAAIEEGDHARAEEIRDRIDEVKEQQRETPAIVVPPASNEQAEQDFNIFLNRNRWYQQDVDMKAWADGYAAQLLNQGIKETAVAFPMIEQKAKQVFPHKFRNPNKDSAPGLEGGSRKQSTSGFQLSADEDRIMTNMIRAGAPITRDEYIAQLKKLRS
jgi:regulator of replication initiation timing